MASMMLRFALTHYLSVYDWAMEGGVGEVISRVEFNECPRVVPSYSSRWRGRGNHLSALWAGSTADPGRLMEYAHTARRRMTVLGVCGRHSVVELDGDWGRLLNVKSCPKSCK